ncbi:MAG: hypothetical protein ORN85_10435, partial [Sediminibacterium sp.]|nr:hypothetical protein [Sediminibacterium sp.]
IYIIDPKTFFIKKQKSKKICWKFLIVCITVDFIIFVWNFIALQATILDNENILGIGVWFLVNVVN